MPHVF